MLVIFGSVFDQDSRRLARRWATYDAATLTARDLSLRGWRFETDRREANTAIIDGRRVPVTSIRAVLTRWPGVVAAELAHVVPEERDYVAAEMTAFLRAWLAWLPCPVVNRPTATSLFGPAWRPEQWVHAAAGLGIPVQRVQRQARLPGSAPEPPADTPTTLVTVVGGRTFGNCHPRLGQWARRLAAFAGVELLAVHFDSPAAGALMLSAELAPDLEAPDIADALLDYLLDPVIPDMSP